MSWSDGGCARAHNPGKRWHVAKAGDGRLRRADQATRMRNPIGFQRLGALRTAAARRWRDSRQACRHHRLAASACCCRFFATPVFICCVQLKSQRANLSKTFQDAALEAWAAETLKRLAQRQPR